MLCPSVEWTIYGDSFNDIQWNSGVPAITEEEFNDGFLKFDKWKKEQDNKKIAIKTSALTKLAALGLTEDEVRAIIGA